MDEMRADNLTLILSSYREDDRSTVARLLPLVYDELRAVAGGVFAGQRSDHTLQPTILVHEAFLKLADNAEAKWKDRKHFFTLAAKVMRQILADYARGHLAAKRGGDWFRVTLDQAVSPLSQCEIDIAALDEAMTRLASLNERHAQIVQLRFLAGLTVEEVAEILAVSRRTVELDWRAARAWLRRELSRAAS